jgi:hypothetical protein
MLRRIAHHENLAVAVAVAQLHGDEFVLMRGGDVAHRQRPLLDGAAQRLPEIIESHPMF